jgi:hypothetical protein
MPNGQSTSSSLSCLDSDISERRLLVRLRPARSATPTGRPGLTHPALSQPTAHGPDIRLGHLAGAAQLEGPASDHTRKSARYVTDGLHSHRPNHPGSSTLESESNHPTIKTPSQVPCPIPWQSFCSTVAAPYRCRPRARPEPPVLRDTPGGPPGTRCGVDPPTLRRGVPPTHPHPLGYPSSGIRPLASPRPLRPALTDPPALLRHSAT